MQGLTFGLGSTEERTLVFISLWFVCAFACVREGERHLCCVVCTTDLLMGGLGLENPVIYCQVFKSKK